MFVWKIYILNYADEQFVCVLEIALQGVKVTKPQKQTRRQETPSVSEVDEENRIKHVIPEDKDTDLERDVKLIQRLLRGRAYQTMVKYRERIHTCRFRILGP